MKGIILQIGVLISTTLWMLRDNPLSTDLTKTQAYHLTKAFANRPHSGARTPLLKKSNTIGVIFPFHFDTNCALTAFVGQKQTPAALQAAAVRSLLKDMSVCKLAHII